MSEKTDQDRIVDELENNPEIAMSHIEILRLTVEWIGNLERAFGKQEVLDQMPNNFGGRVELNNLIKAFSSTPNCGCGKGPEKETK